VGPHYSTDLCIQTHTELVPLKYGKLATKYPYIYKFLKGGVSAEKQLVEQ